MSAEVHNKINHLFRHEYGKLVSVLVRTFGGSNVALAEDVVQEAIAEAIEQWQHKGIPDNAVGWIYTIAKRKALTILQRQKVHQKFISSETPIAETTATLETIFNDQEIEDDQLRMMFMCCHPSLSSDSQIALTLKTLCGFSIPEIASAFLTSEENINKRLVRARQQLRDHKVKFEVPVGSQLDQRVDSVLETLYLLFNEGYNSTHGDEAIRLDLCTEAIRLAKIIAASKSIKNESNTYALLALMLLNTSRFTARAIDNLLLNLREQDRSLWDKTMITQGLNYLENSVSEKTVSVYHILATISAHHCSAKDYDSTDWESILELYDHLIMLDQSPVAYLGRVVAISKVRGADSALNDLARIPGIDRLEKYLPYYTTKSHLEFESGRPEKAISALQEALLLNMNDASRKLINNQLTRYQKKIQNN